MKRAMVIAGLLASAGAFAAAYYSSGHSPGKPALVIVQPGGAGKVAPASTGTGVDQSGTAQAADAALASSITLIGTVTPRSAAQLAAAGLTSPFSIGGETTDRGFSTYANWAGYLGPLGIPSARVQTGWTDIEKTRGSYNFAKLDAIVTGMKGQSVQPWLGLIYGNPIYTGGGTAGLGAKIPTPGTEGWTAWLNFVKATVGHYDTSARRVTEWEIWNEPNGGGNAADAYATFAAETAKAIKSVQPDAKILIGAFTNGGIGAYSTTVINNFAAQRGSVPAADVQVTYHPYLANPDDSYNATFDSFRSLAESKGFSIRQGENGAPSTNQPAFALAGLPWTESAQAKYALRRLIRDFRLGIPSNLFTITDLHYYSAERSDLRAKNTKGLLRTGTYDANDPPTYGDQTVKGKKAAYGAIQALSAVFDSRLQLLTNQGCTFPTGYIGYAFTRLDPGNIRRNLLVIWRTTDRPGENGTAVDINVTCTVFNFPRYKSSPNLVPRYADLLTGQVYSTTAASVSQPNSSGVTITGLRAYDSPVVLADQGIVPVKVN